MTTYHPNCALKSPPDTRDWKASSIYSNTHKAALPKTLDLRPQLQPIRDQGPLGTCAAQTAACIKEWQEKKDVKLDEHLSPQFVYNLRVNQDSEGMYARDVMKILSKHGICRDSIFPYMIPTQPSQRCFEEASNYVIKGYASVDSIEDLKKALYKNGPCYIAFPTYNSGPSFWKPENAQQTMEGGHAVTVVGYDKKGFIIRNSWGIFWGNKGYTHYPYEEFGSHWEIWTTVDENSSVPVPEPEPKYNCLKCTIL